MHRHLCLFSIVAVAAHIISSHPLNTNTAAVKAGQMISRSHTSGACLPEHQAIIQLFLLRGIGDIAFWAVQTREKQPRLRGTQLDLHHDEVFMRELDVRGQHWFGQLREFQANALLPLFELHFETSGSVPPGGPLFDLRRRPGRALVDCDYSRQNTRSTELESERNRIVLGREFWTFPIIPSHEANPRAETQFGLLLRGLLQIPVVFPYSGPLGIDDSGGMARNANRHMYFMQDVYSLYLRLRRAQREGQ